MGSSRRFPPDMYSHAGANTFVVSRMLATMTVAKATAVQTASLLFPVDGNAIDFIFRGLVGVAEVRSSQDRTPHGIACGLRHAKVKPQAPIKGSVSAFEPHPFIF